MFFFFPPNVIEAMKCLNQKELMTNLLDEEDMMFVWKRLTIKDATINKDFSKNNTWRGKHHIILRVRFECNKLIMWFLIFSLDANKKFLQFLYGLL